MSLDLVVSCFRDGELHPEPTALLREPVRPLVQHTEPRCLVLGLADGRENSLFFRWVTEETG